MKVAIVGAGITGLYLAWKLAERDEEVTVFEKKTNIGKKVCSGLFSERILDFVPESRKLIQNKIEHCLIHFPKKTLKIRFSKPFFVISHYQLDNLTADLAEKTGAKILLNSGLLESDSNRLENEFERMIGCDGANSFVRKYLELPEPNFWLAIQGFLSGKNLDTFTRAERRVEKNECSSTVETWPTQNGFLWKIPRGDEVEYGIIEKPTRAKTLFEEFLTKKGIRLKRINPVRSQRFLNGVNSAIIPQGLIIPKNPKITLAGDATGLTKPWSGGGVIWGLFAANLLLKNFPDFIKYQKEARRFFLPKIILSKIAKKTVYFFGFNLPWLLPKNPKIESDFLM